MHSVGLCTRWVLTLLFQGYKNDAIRAALVADDLPCPADAELDAMRAQYKPKGFKLKSPKSVALFEKIGIASFVGMTAEAEQALALLHHARARELTEAGLTTGVPVKALAHVLRTHLTYELAPAAIELYRNMFFDTTTLTRAQLRVAVHARVRLAVMRMVADEEGEVAAQRAVDADARSVAVSLPSSTLGWSAVLMAAGHSPGQPELVDVIGQMETLATVRASESMLRGEPGDERRAEAFVSVLQKIHEIRQGVISPESELTKKLTSFRVAHEGKPMMTVAQLRAGGDEVTVDMNPPSAETSAT